LAALENRVVAAPEFASLLLEAVSADTGRGGGLAPKEPTARFTVMLEQLTTDPLWADEYDKFVNDKSFAKPDEVISFSSAIAATIRLLTQIAL
jgi:hypothetical protein